MVSAEPRTGPQHGGSEVWDAAPIAALLVDPGGVIRLANQAAVRLLGVATGRPFADLLPKAEALRVSAITDATPDADDHRLAGRGRVRGGGVGDR